MRRVRDDKGQTTVEFALCLPLLLLIFFGIFQFGLLFYNFIDLTSATREGARTASVSRTTTDGVARATAAIRKATSAIKDDNATVLITPAQPWQPGTDVTVRVTYPYTLSILGVQLWGGPMETETVVRIE